LTLGSLSLRANVVADLKDISKLVDLEVLHITDIRLADRIREFRVIPYPVERPWDYYGTPGEQFTCWTVLEHLPSNTGIAFCYDGLGPSYPLGLVHLTGPHMSIGMDCGWHVSLEHAMRNSPAWDRPNPEGYEVP
jgi:hypothetical protein